MQYLMQKHALCIDTVCTYMYKLASLSLAWVHAWPGASADPSPCLFAVPRSFPRDAEARWRCTWSQDVACLPASDNFTNWVTLRVWVLSKARATPLLSVCVGAVGICNANGEIRRTLWSHTKPSLELTPTAVSAHHIHLYWSKSCSGPYAFNLVIVDKICCCYRPLSTVWLQNCKMVSRSGC